MLLPNSSVIRLLQLSLSYKEEKKAGKILSLELEPKFEFFSQIQCQIRDLNRIYSLKTKFSMPHSNSLSHQKLNTEYISSFPRQRKTKCNSFSFLLFPILHLFQVNSLGLQEG